MADRATGDRTSPDVLVASPSPPDGGSKGSVVKAHRRRQSVAFLVGVLSLTTVVCIYWLIAARQDSTLTPAPPEVASTFWAQLTGGELLVNLWLSFKRIMAGYAIGMGAAIILGTLAGWFRPIGLVFNPIIDAVRPIPALAYLPLLILWVGVGEATRILVIVLASFKAGVVSTRAGMSEVPAIYSDAARILGASRRRVFWTVALPSSVPYIAAGMRVGFTTSWLAVVAAELIAANGGLGYMIRNAARYFQTDVVLVGIITIGIVAFTLDRLLGAASAYLTRWSERAVG